MINCGMSDLNDIAEAWKVRTEGIMTQFKTTETYAKTFSDYLAYQIDTYARLNEYHARFGHVPIESVAHKRPGGRWLP